MNKKLTIMAIGAALAMFSGFAAAHGTVGVSVAIGGPGYAVTYSTPAPVYYAPAPVYYGPPVVYAPPAYYGPRVYYGPTVVAYPRYYYRGWHHGHR